MSTTLRRSLVWWFRIAGWVGLGFTLAYLAPNRSDAASLGSLLGPVRLSLLLAAQLAVIATAGGLRAEKEWATWSALGLLVLQLVAFRIPGGPAFAFQVGPMLSVFMDNETIRLSASVSSTALDIASRSPGPMFLSVNLLALGWLLSILKFRSRTGVTAGHLASQHFSD
jgi:hypothetical protein